MSNNFEQMSLADFFGTDELGFTPATKKETPKAAPKTSAPKAEPKAKAPVKETKYTLPLKVVSGYANFDLEGEGEVTLAQLKELIFAKAKFLAPAITKVDVKDGVAKVMFKSMPGSTAVLDKAYTVCLNGFEIELPADENAGDEEAELKSVNDAAEEEWLVQYPDFKGCKFLVDEDKAIVVPVMSTELGTESLELPIKWQVFGGEEEELTEFPDAVDGKVTGFKFGTYLTDKLGILTGYCKSADGGTYYAVPRTDPSNKSNSNTSKEVKKISTSCTVVFYGERVTVEPSMFGGKTEVPEKEFLKWVCSPTGGGHDEFGEDRGSWIDFDKKRNLAIPRFPAAKKGAGYSIIEEDGVAYRVQETPIGVFRVRQDRAESGDNSFIYRLPKIPARIWRAVVNFFKYLSAQFCVEGIVQIAYDTVKDDWKILVPEQTVSRTAVNYDPQLAISTCAYTEGMILVADIHSHNRMLPFFSFTDDNDEVGVRLYGVFGDHKGTDYDILLRAGAGGRFCRIPAEDILEGFENRHEEAARLSDYFPRDWLKKITNLVTE
ncbi:MAG: hypothetical protein K6G24_03190 [Lachnospiraceae bacterium]|nr:hypothetical protein [Lachnospiraceae bacterium]